MADDDIKIGSAQGATPSQGAPQGAAPVQGSGQTQASAQQTGSGTPALPKKKTSISLEDEAMMAQEQSFVAPPDKYTVPAMVKEKFPDLVQLIKETESMNDEERDYWFQILPIMTEEQIRKFRDILLNEKNQLQKLDKEYEQELNKLNEKHMLEWKEFEMREKRKAIQTAEKRSQEEEKAAEEELLRRLSQH
jgi:hypothetical protein